MIVYKFNLRALCANVFVALWAYSVGVSSVVALDASDCAANGGDWVCKAPSFSSWKYNVSHSHMTSFPYVSKASCLARDGEWMGVYDGCDGVVQRNEGNLVDFAKRFFEELTTGEDPHCNVSAGAWGHVWTGLYDYEYGPVFQSGALVKDYKRIDASGERCRGGYVIASKVREVVCPEGTQSFSYTTDSGEDRYTCAMKMQGDMCSVGNPILPLTGQKVEAELDAVVNGVEFKRYYNSVSWLVPSFVDTAVMQNYGRNFFGTFGNHWRNNFDYKLYHLSSAVAKYALSSPDGEIIYFDASYKALYRSAGLLDDDSESQQFRYQAKGNQYIFHSNGWLSEIIPSIGSSIEFEYSGDEGIEEYAVDSNGETLDALVPPGLLINVKQNGKIIYYLQYDREGKAIQLTAGSQRYEFGYTATDALKSVRGSSGLLREYSYFNDRDRHLLRTIYDAESHEYSKWTYDNTWRATTSQHAEGSDLVGVAYNYINSSSDPKVVVTNPLGKQTEYYFAEKNGYRRLLSVAGLASENCAAANKSYDYYDNGTLKSKTDWEGNVTTYLRDDWGREISRTEAAGTPDARTITTEYHSEFNKPVKITEPGLITEMTYDSAGRLLNTKKTSTTAQ